MKSATELLAALRVWHFAHAQAAVSSLGAICRSPLGTVLTTAVIGIALALPAGALILVENLFEVSTHFDSGARVSLFLRPGVSDADGERLAREIADFDGVDTVEVVSKARALDELRATPGTDFGLEALGDDNPLPVVLVITPSDAARVATLSALLARRPEIDFVQDDRDWLARLDAIARVLRRFLGVLSVGLSLGILLVVGNTVRLSIESRRDEVEVAKLFGASDAFVRRPFLYHGLYYGIAGAVVAWLLLKVAGAVLSPALEQLSALYSGRLPMRGVGMGELAGLLLVGAGLGLLGAWIWVGRHLRRVEPR